MTQAPIDVVSGKGQGRLSFEDIDQDYRLKIRPLIRLCMPHVFGELEKNRGFAELRAQGIVAVMFFLQFEVEPPSLAFHSPVEADYEIRLRRGFPAGRPGAGGAETGRLLIDMDIRISAREGTGNPAEFGTGKRSEHLARAGRMRALHSVTRPLAPHGERHPVEIPEPLRVFAEHPLDEPYPTVEGLNAPPEGFIQADPGPWHEQRSVWGLQNTDINQHVNVQEYLNHLENHFTRLIFGAGLPVAGHRIVKTDILFRKPFFRGDPMVMRGGLYLQGHRTLMLGGIHPADGQGNADPRPSVFARMAGVMTETA